MLTYEPLTILAIRQRLETALYGSVGTYSDGTPAVWVLDRPLPDSLTVVVAGQHQVLIPALEVIIDPFCSVADLPGNFNHAYMSEVTKIYAIWHDQRQPTRNAALSMVAAFNGYEPDLAFLAASELHLRQHVLTIKNKVMVNLYA